MKNCVPYFFPQTCASGIDKATTRSIISSLFIKSYPRNIHSHSAWQLGTNTASILHNQIIMTKDTTAIPSMEFHCSVTSFCSIDTNDTLSSCFRTTKSRKRPRRVSFAKDIESVRIVENLKLTLTNSEKHLVWEMPDADDFLEQALIHCFCEPKKGSKSVDKEKKRQRQQSRRSTQQKHQQQLIFSEMLSSPSTSHKRRPSEPRKSPKKAECKSPLKCIKAKLGLRKVDSKFNIPSPCRE